MCGIAGISGKHHTRLLEESLAILHHRGPDEKVVKSFISNSFSFGMNRLAIRDLRRNLYPFEYRGYYLIYNGEIYNVDKLSKAAKYRCRTRCDAEPILPLFVSQGARGFDFIVGMFAIAIYDSKNHALILARDKFGEKPLYYQVTSKSISFASELKALPHSREIPAQRIFDYLAFGCQPFRDAFYKDTYKVEAGEFVRIDLKKGTVKRQFYSGENLGSKLQYKNYSLAKTQDIIEKLEKTLVAIVNEKRVADVPVGVYLSGGVDSSLLAALVSRSTSQRVRTFSIKFDAAQYDESASARVVAKYLKTDHREILITDRDVKILWKKLISQLDEPFADPAIFPTYILSREARKQVKVIMSGEGADEFFGGYPRYRKHLQARSIPHVSQYLSKKILGLVPSQRLARLLLGRPETFYTAAQYNTLWRTNKRKKYMERIEETWRYLNRINPVSTMPLPLNFFLYDLHYYIGEQLCMKVDKMTMLHSIESRAPYLDERLYPYMAISADLLTRGYPDKYLLREVAKRYIPFSIANREKHGFSLPLEFWLRKGLREIVGNALTPHPYVQKIISTQDINKIITQFLQHEHNDDLAVWNIVVLDSWLKEHVRY